MGPLESRVIELKASCGRYDENIKVVAPVNVMGKYVLHSTRGVAVPD